MSDLKKFAILHPLQPQQLLRFQETFPDIEFLHSNDRIPAGFELAEAAAIHWTVKNVPEVAAAGTNLKWLHIRGTGIDYFNPEILRQRQIALTNGAGNHAPNIAEHVLAMMFSFARKIPHFVRAQERKSWEPVGADRVFEISGQNLLVIGLGSIGLEVAKRAKALGMQVTGVQRQVEGAHFTAVDVLIALDDLDSALAIADHVVLALPLTPETKGLFNAERLSHVKEGAYLYNVGRGQVIDHGALFRALVNGHIGGAGLDVTDPEPLPCDSPLWDLQNVILTAHTAGATPRSYDRFEALVMENIHRFLEGRPLLNVVNLTSGY